MRAHFVVGLLCLIPGSLHGGEPIEALVARLGDGGEKQKELSDKIIAHGEAAIKPLSRALTDAKSNNVARMEAAMLLGRIGGKKVVEPLRAGLAERNDFARYFSIIALETVGPEAADAVPDLAKLLRDVASEKRGRSSFERHNLINALAKIGGSNQEAVDALVLCMKDQRSHDAAFALINFDGPGAEALVSLAAEYLGDKRPEGERRYGECFVVLAWGSPPLPKEMISVFTKHLEKGDFHSRYVASRALAGVGPPAVPVLAKYLDHNDRLVQVAAAQGLGTMNWFASRSRKGAEKVKYPVSSDEFYPRLKKLCKAPDGALDFDVFQAMIHLDHDRVESDEELMNLWRESVLKVRKKAPKE